MKTSGIHFCSSSDSHFSRELLYIHSNFSPNTLRTFARKSSTTQILFILPLESDDELPMSEYKKKNNGGHRLRSRNKARGKLRQF